MDEANDRMRRESVLLGEGSFVQLLLLEIEE